MTENNFKAPNSTARNSFLLISVQNMMGMDAHNRHTFYAWISGIIHDAVFMDVLYCDSRITPNPVGQNRNCLAQRKQSLLGDDITWALPHLPFTAIFRNHWNIGYNTIKITDVSSNIPSDQWPFLLIPLWSFYVNGFWNKILEMDPMMLSFLFIIPFMRKLQLKPLAVPRLRLPGYTFPTSSLSFINDMHYFARYPHCSLLIACGSPSLLHYMTETIPDYWLSILCS